MLRVFRGIFHTRVICIILTCVLITSTRRILHLYARIATSIYTRDVFNPTRGRAFVY